MRLNPNKRAAEFECQCGYLWAGMFDCLDCYPQDEAFEAALEEYEEKKRERIARENEY